MKLIKVIELNSKLNQVKHLKGRELNYVIEKNLSKLKIEIDILSKQEKDIFDITKEFNDEYKKYQIEAATVDGVLKMKKETYNGSVVDAYDIPEEVLPDFFIKRDALKEKYKEQIKEQEIAGQEFNKMLQEKECDFVIEKVKFQCIPEDISSENMKLVFDLIKEKES